MLTDRTLKKVTLTEQIMEQIAGMITSGQLKPGDQLPNERELAKQFHVTRSRVREALRALALVGLLTIKASEGCFVREKKEPFSPDAITWMFHSEIHNLDEVFAARKLIESEIFIHAAEHATADDCSHLATIHEALVQSLSNQNTSQFLAHLDEFDLYLGDICGNRIYTKLMQTIIHVRRETSLKLLEVPGAMNNSVEIRGGLLAAIATKDKKIAEDAIRTFFKTSKKFYDNILSRK